MLLNNIHYNEYTHMKSKTPHRQIKTFQKPGNSTTRSHLMTKRSVHDIRRDTGDIYNDTSNNKHDQSFQRIIDKNNILGSGKHLKMQKDQAVNNGQNSLQEWFQSKEGSVNYSMSLTQRFGQSKRPSTHMNTNE